jgi:hypothetical protein
MPRRCNDCKYTINTHADRCPKCGGYMAIVCQTGGNAGPEDDPRRKPTAVDRGSGISTRTWVIAAIVIVLAFVGGVAYFNRSEPAGGVGEQPHPAPDQPAARISLGMPIRDAVLALEPEPNPKGRVSLHDLLGPNAPKSGHFAYSEGGRTTTVAFRDGKVTAVNEVNYPAGIGERIPTLITISAEDENAPGAGAETPRP